MHDFEGNEGLRLLLAETISEEEARLLVEWMTDREFADLPGTTLGAVVEATGIDPIQAAKLLNEWRGHAFEERISTITGDHDKRIGSLEETTESLKLSAGLPPKGMDREDLDILKSLTSARRYDQKAGPASFVALVLFAIVVAAILVAQVSKQPGARGGIIEMALGGGTLVLRGDHYYLREPGGKERAATDEEITASHHHLEMVQSQFDESPTRPEGR